MSQDFGRVTAHYGKGRHVFGDDTAHSDYGTLPDTDAGDNINIHTKPDVLLDDHRPADQSAVVGDPSVPVVVNATIQCQVTANMRIITDNYPPTGIDVPALLYADILPHKQTLRPLNCHRLFDNRQPPHLPDLIRR